MIDLTPDYWKKQLEQLLHSDDLRERLLKRLHQHYADAACLHAPAERAEHFARIGRIAPEIETEQRIALAKQLCSALEITSTVTVGDRLLRLLFGQSVARGHLLGFGMHGRTAAAKFMEDAQAKLQAFQSDIEAAYGPAPAGKPPLHPYADVFCAFSAALRAKLDTARDQVKPKYFK